LLSRQQRKDLNTEFYTALGRVMQGSFSETGNTIKWTNYRTRIRHIYVRLETDHLGARFAVELQHPDEGIRQLYWEQFLELKTLMQSEFDQDLNWQDEVAKPNGTMISSINCSTDSGSVYKKETWPELFAFLKENLLAFDRFWASAFDIFKALE
jgi:hypothetical protein